MKLFQKKSFVALFCSILVVIFSMQNAFASTIAANTKTVTFGNLTYTINTLVDSSTTKKVQVIEGKNIVVTELNKKTGEMKINQNGNITTANINNTKSNGSSMYSPLMIVPGDDDGYTISRNSSFRNQFSCVVTGFGDGKKQWALETPRGRKIILQNSSNQTTLESYRTSVNTLVSKEALLLASIGATTVAVIVAGVALAGPTLGASAIISVAAAAGAGVANYAAVLEWYNTSQDCLYYYTIV